MGKIIRYWLSVLATTGIVLLSLLPMPEIPALGVVPLWDKWVHFVMYGGLCCAYWLDFHRNGFQNRQKGIWLFWIVLFPMALGGLMEICQATLTTCRNGDWIDFVANCVGVVLALPVGLFVIPRFFRKRQKAAEES